jgi:mannonate dehydratase
MNRRQFLLGASALGVSSIANAGFDFWPDIGFKNPCLANIPSALIQHPFMHQIWSDITPSNVWDSHAHLIGTGDSDSGVWFNPNMDSLMHPTLKLQKYFYMNGACADPESVDTSVVSRMLQLHQGMPIGYKSMLFAFDWFRDAHGNAIKSQSIFHIPNDYAASMAKAHPAQFEWVASIHPYRKDAVDQLDEVFEKGAKAIKWLPSGMGIDPADAKCDAFYKKAAALNLPIITHGGHEAAVQGGDQAHGNPLRVRRALDHGVRVVVAHCASDGEDEDLDHAGKTAKSFDLFARLMDNPEYEGVIFGEISALTLFNHAWAIKPLLARTDWHHRLLNGTDYPLPSVFPLINTKQLKALGLIDETAMLFLQDVKKHNALLFDFAAKRLISYNGNQFNRSVFETKAFFDQNAA